MNRIEQKVVSQKEYLENAYDYLNSMLFNNELPKALILIDTERDDFFAEFRHSEGVNTITFTKVCFGEEDDMYLLSILAHEMSHFYVYLNARKEKTHGKTWQKKMNSIGLPPDDLRVGFFKDDSSHSIKRNNTFEVVSHGFKSMNTTFPRYMVIPTLSTFIKVV